jgi:hypothetical protein
MQREDLAVLVSFISLAVAATSLGWNIYRDMFLRGRLRVRFGLRHIHHPTFPKPLRRFVFSVTNLGPGKVKIQMLQLRKVSLWKRIRRKCEFATLFHDYEHPLGGQLPYDLEPGQGMNLTFPVSQDSFAGEGYTHIGISDSFGRIHWCSRREMYAAQEAFNREEKEPV